MSDRPVAETFTWQHSKPTINWHTRPPAGFEPAIPANKPPQTHALDRAANGIVKLFMCQLLNNRGRSGAVGSDLRYKPKVADSISDGVTVIFYLLNPSDRTIALVSTQPLTEMNTSDICLG